MENTPAKIAVSPKTLAEMYEIDEGTLANYRSQKIGPKFYKIGRKVLYFLSDVEEWARKEPVLTKDSFYDF